jgi:hypothetical protein
MKRPPFLLLILTAAVFAGCSEGIVTNPNDIVFPSSDVSYARNVQPLFDLSCSLSGCHDSYTRGGGLSLGSYFDLIDRPGIVVPGDSARSLLVQVMSGRQIHAAYPMSKLINDNQQHGVAVWVQEGASNN